MSALEPRRFPLRGVALDVRSLYNIGAIFRASDAAAVEHLHLLGGCGHPDCQRQAIEKTALGSIDTVPWSYALEPLPVLASLRERGTRLIALELTAASRPLAELTVDDLPLALIVGHETDGIRPEVLAVCDQVVAIPTYGSKASLNVALAYGVAMLRLADLCGAAPR